MNLLGFDIINAATGAQLVSMAKELGLSVMFNMDERNITIRNEDPGCRQVADFDTLDEAVAFVSGWRYCAIAKEPK